MISLNQINWRNFNNSIICMLLLLLSYLTMQAVWVEFPLSKGLSGNAVFILFDCKLWWLSLALYIAAFSLIILRKRLGFFLLSIPVLLALMFPLLGLQDMLEILPVHVEEARSLALIERLFGLKFPANININYNYHSYFDVFSPWEQLALVYTSLSFAWYVYCVCGMLLVLFISLRYKSDGRLVYFIYPLSLMLCITLAATYNYRYDFRVSVSSDNNVSQSADIYQQCNMTLKSEPFLRFSGHFLARCAEQHQAIYGDAFGINQLPIVHAMLSDKSVISQFKSLENTGLLTYLNTLKHVPRTSDFFVAINDYGHRRYRDVYNSLALSFIERDDHVAALNAIALIPASDQDVGSFFLKAYARAQMGDTAEVLRHFDNVLSLVATPVILANFLCLIADSFSLEGNKALARDYFRKCEDVDGEGNYWAVMGLGGG